MKFTAKEIVDRISDADDRLYRARINSGSNGDLSNHWTTIVYEPERNNAIFALCWNKDYTSRENLWVEDAYSKR